MHGRVGGSPEKGLGVPVVRSGVYVCNGRKAKALHCTGPGRQGEHLGHSPGKASDATGRVTGPITLTKLSANLLQDCGFEHGVCPSCFGDILVLFGFWYFNTSRGDRRTPMCPTACLWVRRGAPFSAWNVRLGLRKGH